MPRRRSEVPFPGIPPPVGPGDVVWCRTSCGRWLRKACLAGPRYDHRAAFGTTVTLTVPVAPLDAVYHHEGHWYRHGRRQIFTHNWPAADVLPDQPEPPGPLWRGGRQH